MRPIRKPLKRGEREARNLIRRRRMNLAFRIGSVASVALGVVGAVYMWQSNLLEQWVQGATDKMNVEFSEAGLVLEEIRIKGQKETALVNIREALGVSHGISLMALDLPSMKENVEKLVWVKEATLMRVMPSALEVTITEYRPAALWQEQERLWIITRSGAKITDQRLAHFSGLPMVVGQGADQAIGGLIALLDVTPDFFNRIKSATWVGQRRWDLLLKEGVNVRLPERNMKEAWVRLEEMIRAETLLEKDIVAVDLRVAGKTILRLSHQAAKDRRTVDMSMSVREDI